MPYKKTILKNGLRIITVPMKDNPTVTVFALVEAGSKYETKDINGISHFLEHMCFKGTTNRPTNYDISTELDSIGSHYNAFTSQEYTGYYAKVEHRHLEKALDIISDMYLNPLLNEKELEKEKGVIIEEINMYEDLPQKKVEMIFDELLYGDQPAGWAISGLKENIINMKREDFLSYRNKFYTSEATTIVIAGNFEEKKVIKNISKIFGNMKKIKKGSKQKVIERQEGPKIKIFNKDTDQTHLILGVRTFSIYDKRHKVMRVLEGVLDAGMSSRLFKKLRDEMGICYYVHAMKNETTDCGTFSVNAGVNSERLKEAVIAILAEFKKLKEQLVSPEELKKVKQYLIGTSALTLETSDSLAQFYGGQEIMNEKIKTPDEIKKEIESVTAQDVRKLAREIFVDKNLNLAIVGKQIDENNLLNILKL